jgi:hypothetical protein
VSMNPEYRLSIRAISILFNYLKNGKLTISVTEIQTLRCSSDSSQIRR